MNFHEAAVADILRCNQRDQAVVGDLESKLHSLLKHLNPFSYHRLRNYVPAIANVWYYYMTTLGNLQTLGEEYTGTIRLTKVNTVPSQLRQIVWMILYIGGEPLLERILKKAEKTVKSSETITQQAKDFFLKCIQCLKEQKQTIKRIHYSLFYIHGKYYNISNRMTGIKYVLLRSWMQNNSFSSSFKLLGNLSLFYILFNIVQNSILKDFPLVNDKPLMTSSASISTKLCILCTDHIKNPTATPCGHIFCWHCLYDSLNYQKVCPICREKVLPNRIIFLQNYI